MADELKPLVMTADLQVYDIDVSNGSLVKEIIEAVSAKHQRCCGCAHLEGHFDGCAVRRAVLIPPSAWGPLLGVEEVQFNEVPVTDYKVRDGALWRRSGWGDIEDDVTVTFTHGWDPV
ncbi:hypothetical protein [Nesterenkonia pannonica]|uniref:hypothetical protein n=1 Tax=Nesterenkonia pannonica TaxID=1548602 RepID=UPI00216458FE|nr:hypothetical protein [Nesterenkonia pannonica]